jgi:hypothetical protein
MGARLSFFRAFAADILLILSADSGWFAGGLGKLHQDFSNHPHPYTLDLLISNIFCPDQSSIWARSKSKYGPGNISGFAQQSKAFFHLRP